VITLLWVLPVACGGSEETAPAATPRAEQAASQGGPLRIGEPLEPSPFTLEQRFLEAARQGDRATLERALERGVALESKDDLGRSALLLSVRDAGSLEALRFLESRGARVDEPDTGGRTPLSYAAGAGRLDLVAHLAGKGALVDQPDLDQRTPLYHAAAGRHPEVAAWLLDHGARVDAADVFGDTPLMLACAKGHGDVAALLLARGADPSLRNQEGRTARDRAASGADVCLTPGPT
jgi:hypothetical protein